MHYDPIKRSLGKVFNTTPALRKLFYKLLDLLLLRAWHIRKELRQWQKSNGEEATILDAGAGFGQYVYFVSCISKKYKITGVDVKDEQIQDCNNFFAKIGKKDQVHFEYGDLTKFKNENSYNLIISVDVMEHILEDVDVFKNFHASLKDKGMVMISTPSDQGGSDVHEHDDESFVGEHVRDGYNINEIEEKLKSAGFSKVEAKYSYGSPGKLSWKLSMKYPILMVNFTKILFLILPVYYILTFPLCLILNAMDVSGNHKSGTGLIVKAWK